MCCVVLCCSKRSCVIVMEVLRCVVNSGLGLIVLVISVVGYGVVLQ